MKELFIGLMSGTSMDAVDAALVDFSEKPLQLIATHSKPIPNELRSELINICTPGNNEINRLGELDVQVGILFAETVNELIKKANVAKDQIIAIGSHGQTIRHQPHGKFPFTLQIGDPNIIAAKTGITTIADFRRRDMAFGGQGAPLAPAFHNYVYRTPRENRIILNLGGIANITYLPANLNQPVIGFDTGPANTLLDNWIHRHLNVNFDTQGQWAASGKCNNELLDLLLTDPYFNKTPPKSTGREYFNLTWLERYLTRLKIDSAVPAETLRDGDYQGENRDSPLDCKQKPLVFAPHLNKKAIPAVSAGIAEIDLTPVDIQATLCELTAKSIALAINKITSSHCTIFVCGGGSKNDYLIERLKAHCNKCNILATDNLDIPAKWSEAILFAWLAQQTINKKTGNLSSVTGAAQETILGGVYFAR